MLASLFYSRLTLISSTFFYFTVDLLYEQVGTNKITDFTDVEKLLDAMPSAKMTLQNNIGRFLDTEEGILLLQDMAIAALKQ